ncbi:MAG: hypothetical protein ACI4S3_07380 [Candidatus Gastranaerophilaceae bacterium]
MINQNFENITQSGTSQTIEANVTGMNLTSAQFYFCTTCITIVLIVSVIMITRLIQTIILKINFINPKLLNNLKKEIIEELNKE